MEKTGLINRRRYLSSFKMSKVATAAIKIKQPQDPSVNNARNKKGTPPLPENTASIAGTKKNKLNPPQR